MAKTLESSCQKERQPPPPLFGARRTLTRAAFPFSTPHLEHFALAGIPWQSLLWFHRRRRCLLASKGKPEGDKGRPSVLTADRLDLGAWSAPQTVILGRLEGTFQTETGLFWSWAAVQQRACVGLPPPPQPA